MRIIIQSPSAGLGSFSKTLHLHQPRKDWNMTLVPKQKYLRLKINKQTTKTKWNKKTTICTYQWLTGGRVKYSNLNIQKTERDYALTDKTLWCCLTYNKHLNISGIKHQIKNDRSWWASLLLSSPAEIFCTISLVSQIQYLCQYLFYESYPD